MSSLKEMNLKAHEHAEMLKSAGQQHDGTTSRSSHKYSSSSSSSKCNDNSTEESGIPPKIDVDNSSTTLSRVESSEYDEIQEIRDHSKKENINVNISRTILVFVLLAVGVAVTWTTYIFLEQDETHAFETAFEQFSKTVVDSAERQHQSSRNAYRSMANVLTAYAQSTNATWPFVTFPFYETYAEDFFVQSGLEIQIFLPFVKGDLRDSWVEYANDHYEEMTYEAHMLRYGGLDRLQPVGYNPFISSINDGQKTGFEPDEQRDFYFPSWQYSPPPFTYGITNWNIAATPDYEKAINALLTLKNETIVTRVRKYVSAGIALSQEEHEAMHSKLPPGSSTEHPHSIFFHPVHEKVNDNNSPIVGILVGGMAWDASLLDLLPPGVDGLHTVIKNDCDQQFTYEIKGPEAIFLGDGDHHDSQYERYEKIVNLAIHTHPDFSSTPGHCQFSMHVYPTEKFETVYRSNVPITYAIVVASTFVLVAIFFLVYNLFVNRRNEKLVQNAAKSNAVIHALFPKNIRDRIMEDEQKQSQAANKKKNAWSFNKSSRVRSTTASSSSEDGSPTDMNRPPLADYFPETTILSADISGFTAWSSVREPSQVFTLLETLYGAFDKLAKQSRVFKVETVGDCYVAATGIPDFHPEHAVHMVRFARKILTEMEILTKNLEISLGPDTGDLSLRVGIHSGPVTAGVLRGERARFQLFGDTMNTASRLENSSEEGRIHISSETAELLKTFGKQHWLVKRKEPVKIKGKGDIQTYWIGANYDRASAPQSSGRFASTNADDNCSYDGSAILTRKTRTNDGTEAVEREARLVDWNVRMLMDFLKQIVARRIAAKGLNTARNINYGSSKQSVMDDSMSGHIAPNMDEGFYPLNEVREVIRLPEFDSKVAKLQKNHQLVEIPLEVEQQLHTYVTCIARMYRRNQFHNFEHASHVTMSVIKLLSRIVAPTDIDDDLDRRPDSSLRAQLHDHTYGITSDPLTQFACAFSALIHDVDHQGVPNAQLIKEKTDIAARFKDRSIAEQNSMVIAWNLLMEDRFKDLRLCLCETPKELRRFRNLVINGVMATDITDKDLKNLRNARWEKAFKESSFHEDITPLEQDVRDAIHRKATIVIEHLIQASDVAHTMQHWHVYRKWNENFFRECYAAYKAGRAETDPSVGWYKGEIGFFDFYIIPLAKKLDTCGVFGKSSDEYLNYALQNREEWKTRGEDVVAEMIAAVEKEYSDEKAD